jgi:hypothetical protein
VVIIRPVKRINTCGINIAGKIDSSWHINSLLIKISIQKSEQDGLMESQHINPTSIPHDYYSHLSQTTKGEKIAFRSLLGAEFSSVSINVNNTGPNNIISFTPFTADIHQPKIGPKLRSANKAYAAYQKHAGPAKHINTPVEIRPMKGIDTDWSGWEKYKDDQLLSNPGGDYYYLDQNRVESMSKGQTSFCDRLMKDITDALGNIKNFFKDILFGSEIRYRDESNQIHKAKQKGLAGSFVDFFKDVGSALSFGLWRPDGEEEPKGFLKRTGYFFSKINEAIFGDMIQGTSESVIHAGEDVALAGWNLLEVVPDATIGNFSSGEKLTTTIFDNGQVVIDYLTDILPGGEAWLRVHAVNLSHMKDLKPPILYNIKNPEHHTKDIRWQYVRNTPFRKTIETIGSILGDIVTVKFFTDTNWLDKGNHHKKQSSDG